MKNRQIADSSTAHCHASANPALRRPREEISARSKRKLSRLLDSNETFISEICHYLVDGGGKRLRPLFILLVYRACGGTEREC